MVSRYDQWPKAFISLRDLVYGKYNFVNESFAPFIGKGIAQQEVQRFPKQYINAPYVEKPIPYQRGWQVTNKTLLGTIIQSTKNPEVYDIDEQKDLVQIALDKGADPLYEPQIEKNSPGFDRELDGNALQLAMKYKNIGALEALIDYLKTNNMIETLNKVVKSSLISTLKDILRTASDEQQERIEKLIADLDQKKIEDYEALD
jgi:hypothetical protein